MTYRTYVAVQAVKWLAIALVLSPPLLLPIAFTLLYGRAHFTDDVLFDYNFSLCWIGIIWDAPTFYFLHCIRKGYFQRDWQNRESMARAASRELFLPGPETLGHCWLEEGKTEDENG